MDGRYIEVVHCNESLPVVLGVGTYLNRRVLLGLRRKTLRAWSARRGVYGLTGSGAKGRRS